MPGRKAHHPRYKERILQLINAGKSNIEIGRELNIHPVQISVWLRTRYHISRHIKMSDEQKEMIKQMRLVGKGYKEISDLLHIVIHVIVRYCHKNKIFPIKEKIPEGMKRCGRCGKVKLFSEFNKSKKNIRLGLSSECKQCNIIKHKEYNARPEIKEKAKRKRENLSEEQKAINRKKRNAYESKRWRNDISWRLGCYIRAIMHSHLLYGKDGLSWKKILGYTINDLKQHLEKLFKPGMTWDNHGEWHIDHIIPISRFNFSSYKDIDFLRCWALENLQPLWAQENYVKNDNIDKPFQPCLEIMV